MDFATFQTEFDALQSRKDNVKDLISSLNEGKIGNIKQVINEINELIVERQALSNAMILEYDSLQSKINSIIARVNPENIKEEIILQDKSILVEEAKLKEKLDCWRDIALLKRELRERLRESREEQQKNDSYSELLGN